MMQVLLIEDDKTAAGYLAKGLKEVGYQVEHAADGAEGLVLAGEDRFDILIVDRMLPKLDGLTLVDRVRAQGIQTPVLFLSALDAVDHRVEGLRAGGDDYLGKPFAFSELHARVEALVRRRRPEQVQTRFQVGDLVIDMLSREVTRAGKKIDLQPREFKLLEVLARHAGQVVTRTMLLEEVWGYHFDPQTNVIDVHVSRLRGKLDRDFDEPLLQTVRGAGYRLQASASESTTGDHC